MKKSVHDMLLAYDDPAGVTAAFNLNLLARINRELGGDFILRHFEHHVRYQEMDSSHRYASTLDPETDRVDSGRGLHLYPQEKVKRSGQKPATNSELRRFLALLNALDSCVKRNGSIPNGPLPRTF